MASSDTIGLLRTEIEGTDSIITRLEQEIHDLDVTRDAKVRQLVEEREERTKLQTALNALGVAPGKTGLLRRSA